MVVCFKIKETHTIPLFSIKAYPVVQLMHTHIQIIYVIIKVEKFRFTKIKQQFIRAGSSQLDSTFTGLDYVKTTCKLQDGHIKL